MWTERFQSRRLVAAFGMPDSYFIDNFPAGNDAQGTGANAPDTRIASSIK
jgi:hypothetical protein